MITAPEGPPRNEKGAVTGAHPSIQKVRGRYSFSAVIQASPITPMFCPAPPSVRSSRQYVELIASRIADGSLIVFKCFNCGRMSADPIGRNGKRQFLCENCAGGDRCGEEL
jgi:hypothetical protein